MFYIKTKLASGKVIQTDVTDENVFTRCADCGRELPVDFAEIFSDGEGDLFSTSIVCSACTRNGAEKRRHTDGVKITTDGLALLADALCGAGYGKRVDSLFDDYEIEAVRELAPEQYEPFAAALKSLAAEDGGV